MKASHLAAKEKSWNRQAAALDAPAYRITLTDGNGKAKPWNMGKGQGPDGAEKFYTAAEVKDLIPKLSAKNAQGRNIYITPIDDKHHYILLDDSTTDKIDQLKTAGFKPALVQTSSPGNIQAIFKVAKSEVSAVEQSAGNAVLRRLNNQFGDPNITAVIHPFRMAGFSNRKPKHKNAQGNYYPFVQLIQTPGGQCEKMSQVMVQERTKASAEAEKIAQGRAAIEAERRRTLIKAVDAGRKSFPRGENWGLSDAEHSFLMHRRDAEKLAKAKGWPIDDSKLDFRACKALLRTHSQDDVKAVLIKLSPAIEERHSDLDRYVSTTVEHAQDAIDKDQTIAAARAQQDRGPSL